MNDELEQIATILRSLANASKTRDINNKNDWISFAINDVSGLLEMLAKNKH